MDWKTLLGHANQVHTLTTPAADTADNSDQFSCICHNMNMANVLFVIYTITVLFVACQWR